MSAFNTYPTHQNCIDLKIHSRFEKRLQCFFRLSARLKRQLIIFFTSSVQSLQLNKLQTECYFEFSNWRIECYIVKGLYHHTFSNQPKSSTLAPEPTLRTINPKFKCVPAFKTAISLSHYSDLFNFTILHSTKMSCLYEPTNLTSIILNLIISSFSKGGVTILLPERKRDQYLLQYFHEKSCIISLSNYHKNKNHFLCS